MKTIINYFRMPSRNFPTCMEWDKMLNHLLDNHKIVKIDRYKATFDNDVEVWIENRWHAFGYPNDGPKDILPSRTTAVRLWNAIKDNTAKKQQFNDLKKRVYGDE